jgi:hypothetical protein
MTRRPARQIAIDAIRRYKWVMVSVLAVLVVTAGAELWMGRLPLGPDGRFGFWEGDIWSSEQSQALGYRPRHHRDGGGDSPVGARQPRLEHHRAGAPG